MKRAIIWGKVLFVAIALSFTQCVFEETPEITVEPGVSFSDQIVPIFEARCNTPVCHNTGGADPDLTPNNAWASLQSGYINLEDPGSSLLVTSMDGGSMASYSTDEDIALIRQWIAEGALDN